MKQFYVTATAAFLVLGSAVSAQENWTGAYAGLSLGVGEFDSDLKPSLSDLDTNSWGAMFGYQHDLGNVVLGGEVEVQRVDGFVGTTGDQITLKARMGYDFGRVQPYAMIGHTDIDDNNGTAMDGMTYGIGMDYQLNNKFRLGAEYVATGHFDDGQGNDGSSNNFSLRLMYGF